MPKNLQAIVKSLNDYENNIFLFLTAKCVLINTLSLITCQNITLQKYVQYIE